MRSQTNLEERLDVIRYDLGLGSSEHAQYDDRTSTLESRDVLGRTYPLHQYKSRKWSGRGD